MESRGERDEQSTSATPGDADASARSTELVRIEPTPASLADAAVETARRWAAGTGAHDRGAERLAGLLQDPDGLATIAQGGEAMKAHFALKPEGRTTDAMQAAMAGDAGRGRPARAAGPSAVTSAFRAEHEWGCPAAGPARV